MVLQVASDLSTRVNVIDQGIHGLDSDGDGIGSETLPHSNESGLNQATLNEHAPDGGASHEHVTRETGYLFLCE